MKSAAHNTRGIDNKGVSDMRKFVARFNVSCTMIGNRTQRRSPHGAKRNNPLLAIPPSLPNIIERSGEKSYG